MDITAFETAQKLFNQASLMLDRKAELEKLVEHADAITNISISTNYIASNGEFVFKLGTNSGKGRLIIDQPERITILTRAFVVCLLDAYNQELQKVDKEFKAL